MPSLHSFLALAAPILLAAVWVCPAGRGRCAGAPSAPPPPASSAGSYRLRWVPPQELGADSARVEVTGLSDATERALRRADWTLDQWQRLLAVYATQGDLAADIGLPPMLGRYSLAPGGIRFVPRFPLDPGVEYRAVLRLDLLPRARGALKGTLNAMLRVPPRAAQATTFVREVYPSQNALPENLLKFYVHFSHPMTRGHIYDHIHLEDARGRDIELPFLEIDEELWDPAMTRLTLFIDPGRIKRGVRPLEEIGPALEAGHEYVLRIDRAWQDANGQPLQADFRKPFRVGAPDREPPDPARWKLDIPSSGTLDPLVIRFPESMDHALAQRLIRVTTSSSAPVAGRVSLEDHEQRWVFQPAAPWTRGDHHVVIQTTVEDLAGNNIGKPFEVDLFDSVQRTLPSASVNLPFRIP